MQAVFLSFGREAFFFFFGLFRAAHMAHGGSQARGGIRAVAAGLRHSHSNVRSKHVFSLHHSSRQCRILNPLSKARDPTCNLKVPSQIG